MYARKEEFYTTIICFGQFIKVPEDNFYRKMLSELNLDFIYKATKSIMVRKDRRV